MQLIFHKDSGERKIRRSHALLFLRRSQASRSDKFLHSSFLPHTSYRFHSKKVQQKTAKPLKLRGFSVWHLWACHPRVLVPAVGLEPTRVISSTDFESVTSAIPSHRRAAFRRGSHYNRKAFHCQALIQRRSHSTRYAAPPFPAYATTGPSIIFPTESRYSGATSIAPSSQDKKPRE